MTGSAKSDALLGLVLVGLVPAVLFSVASLQVALYGSTVATGALFLAMLWRHGYPLNPSPLAVSTLALWLATAGIGFVNVFAADNDLSKYAIYAVLYLLLFFSLIAGERMGQAAAGGPRALDPLLVFFAALAVAESLSFLPRVAVVGWDARSSIGYSFLFPSLLYVVALRIKRGGVAAFGLVALTVTFAIIAILSGQRSLVVATIVLLTYAFAAFSLRAVAVTRVALGLAISTAAILTADVLEWDHPVAQVLDRKLAQVEGRLNRTLFSESGIDLDPDSSRGREEEAKRALAHFFDSQHVAVDTWVGRGFGFVYPSLKRDGTVAAHVHLTPVGYFVRSGVLGSVYLALLAWIVLAGFLRCHLRRCASEIRLLWAICVVWFVVGLFSGLLNSPSFWFLVGFLVAYDRAGRAYACAPLAVPESSVR